MRRVLLLLLASAWLGACGGSSSETPFPLEPDLEQLEGTPATRYIVVEEGHAADGATEAVPSAEPAPGPPAPATWGAPAARPDASNVPDVPLQ